MNVVFYKLKNMYKFLKYSIVCMILFLLSGCEEKLTRLVLPVDITGELIQDVPQNGGTYSYTVKYSGEVTIASTEKWCTWDYSPGTGNLTITVAPNDGKSRSAQVTVNTFSNPTIRIQMNQGAPPTLLDKMEAINGLVGFWDFEDASDLGKATVGKDLVTYMRTENNRLGSPTTEGISQVAGPGVEGSAHAVAIGHQNLFFCDHGISPREGNSLVDVWTIIWDINRPSTSSGWGTLLNTNINNADDQDIAIRPEGAIGVGNTGYTNSDDPQIAPNGPQQMEKNKWYRVVIVLNVPGNYYRIYVNGVQWLEGNKANVALSRFQLDPNGTLLMGDNDSDDEHTIHVSSLAIFNRAISETEIRSLGGL